ncbi:MAG: sporulation transcription factor Spo0A [Clostridia bacterium]|nr:sporulation transcription factor Spo0A [Clostridia bacterium]
MSRLSVLFADDFDGISKRFCEFEDVGFNYRTCCKDGGIVLEEIKKRPVDVLVIDFFMKTIDALGILERLKLLNPLYSPAVIVISGIENSAIKNEVLKKGADYYLNKPVTTETIISKIQEIKRMRENNMLRSNAERYYEDCDAIITNMIHQVCIPAHLKGYNYLRYAIKLCVESPDYLNSVTKELYPKVADNYSATSASVERSMRNAIDIAWGRGETEGFSKYFGYNSQVRKKRPTNSEFIARISDEIRIIYNVS